MRKGSRTARTSRTRGTQPHHPRLRAEPLSTRPSSQGDALLSLQDLSVPYVLSGHSALDHYLGHMLRFPILVSTELSLPELAARMPELRYPSLGFCDAAAAHEGHSSAILFRTADSDHRPYYDVLDFHYDPITDRFLDPRDVYTQIRSMDIEEPAGDPDVHAFIEAAVLVSRYRFSPHPLDWPARVTLDATHQRVLLSMILTGKRAHAGLQYLWDSGFVAAHWPELLPMNETDHSKEQHPEGNVWSHTLETMRYRKVPELRLSLALLLHDIGKPHSRAEGGYRFAKHASIGTAQARRFMRRLGIQDELQDDVAWMVHSHMIPGALARLPVSRVGDTMAHPLFPELLELFRCDLSSTFTGPEKYYEACKRYRGYLKHQRNPFRDAEGKKRFKLFVAG